LDELSGQLQEARKRDEESSLGGIIENANKALIQGWSAMVESVERELERAQENIAESRRENARPKSQAAPDKGDSPSGEGPL
ncbi:MAG: hypothetical protein JJ903_07665, partial [Spongiibacter sp.]